MSTPTFTGAVPPPPRKPRSDLELPMPLRLEVGDVFAIPHKAGNQHFTVTETGYEPFEAEREWPAPLAAPAKLKARYNPETKAVDLEWDYVPAHLYQLGRKVDGGDWESTSTQPSHYYKASDYDITNPSNVKYRIRSRTTGLGARYSEWTESAIVLVPELREKSEENPVSDGDVSSTARNLRHTLRYNARRLSADLQRFTNELYATKRPKGKRRRDLRYKMADTDGFQIPDGIRYLVSKVAPTLTLGPLGGCLLYTSPSPRD